MSFWDGPNVTYLVALGLAFGTVVFLVLGVRYAAGGRASTLRDRLHRFTTRRAAAAPAPADDRPHARLIAALSPVARLATPTSEEELGRLRARLTQCGFRGERALPIYLASKVALSLALGIVALALASVFALRLLPTALATISAMTAGFYAPSALVSSRLAARQAEINHSLPNALDLLVTCVEAGLGLDAAMTRVATELGLSAPLLSHELRQTALEISAGLPRGQAFRRMADRTGVDEVRSLAAIIVQTQMFGTSIARSLRIQSDSMRVRRMQLAEERAATVGVKLTVPLIFCIVPALLVVLMAPGAVRIFRHLLPILSGGH